jgi:hypothetical protein
MKWRTAELCCQCVLPQQKTRTSVRCLSCQVTRQPISNVHDESAVSRYKNNVYCEPFLRFGACSFQHRRRCSIGRCSLALIAGGIAHYQERRLRSSWSNHRIRQWRGRWRGDTADGAATGRQGPRYLLLDTCLTPRKARPQLEVVLHAMHVVLLGCNRTGCYDKPLKPSHLCFVLSRRNKTFNKSKHLFLMYKILKQVSPAGMMDCWSDFETIRCAPIFSFFTQ